jgi:hypothetical protein
VIFGETTNINWELTANPKGVVTQDMFDVILISPSGVFEYLVNPTINWIQPLNTAAVQQKGNITYAFTTEIPGRWQIKLVTGTDADYEILDRLFVHVTCDFLPIITEVNSYAIPVNRTIVCVGDQPARTGPYNKITAAGRHAEVGKIVFICSTLADPLNNSDTIAILDRASGEEDAVTHYHALDGLSPSASAQFRGIDCNRATGMYVVGGSTYNGQPGNKTPCYYSYDLDNWTECNMFPANVILGYIALWYDDPLGLWVAASEYGPYLSKDGINFYLQDYNMYYNVVQYPQDISRFPRWGSFAPSWMNPHGDRVLMAGDKTAVYELKPDSIPYVGALPLRATAAGNLTDEARIIAGISWPAPYNTIEFGVVRNEAQTSFSFAGDRMYAMTKNEFVTRTMLGGSSYGEAWDDSTYDFTYIDGWDDLDTPTVDQLQWIDGNWWICNQHVTDRDRWYRWPDEDGSGGPPPTVAGGWIQDSNGPYGVTAWSTSGSFSGGVPYRQFSQNMTWPDEGWVVINSDINGWAGNPVPSYTYWLYYRQ